MDDAQTYLLNGLLTRQFGLGRIVRFREVVRGEQATTYELLTAQQNEYLVHLLPALYSADQLEFAAASVNTLDENRFSVVPFQKTKEGSFVGQGPQNSLLLVSLAPIGSPLPSEQYTLHDISQVGLRLAWMHRLMSEHISIPETYVPLSARLLALPSLPANVEPLMSALNLPAARGWVHGQISAACLLHDGDHQLRTITDWSLMHVGSPLEDMVDAVLSLCIAHDRKSDRLLMERAGAMLEAYSSLIPLKRVPWTPVVASWCAQRLLDAPRRPLSETFLRFLARPEDLATALASCL